MTDLLMTVNALLMDGDTTAALAQLDDHLAAHPDDTAARRARAELHVALHTPDHLHAALDDFAHIEAERTANDCLYLARIYDLLGLADPALAVLHAGLALDPTHPRLLQRLAEVLLAQGRFRDSLDQIDKLPRDWRQLQMVGDVLFDLGLAHNMGREQAIIAYTSALDILPLQQWAKPFRARMHLRLANIHQRLGDHKAVEREAAAAAKLIPDEPAVLFYQGWAQVKRGKPERALPLLQKAFAKAADPIRDEFRQTLAADPSCAALLDSL
ncbi:MAG: hypothetical protein MUC99_03040 [Anaerolineae bacterium]|jgi:tetratricopeptide (TPR) repeat protein|nr:hypothetical protein [Anaerolineae bacterium]